ncbi:MAG TPA: hypothetical protein VGB52_15495 [Actinomycetota bacterium]
MKNDEAHGPDLEAHGADLEALAKGLWGRLRDVLLVAERIESFSFTADADEPERAAVSEADADAVATDFVLRALRAASERTAWTILERTADAQNEGVALEDLAAALGLPRLVVSERVSDLLQIGLAARALDTDRVFATPAGLELVRVVRSVAGGLSERVRKARRAEGGKVRGDGLPIL